MSRMFSRLSAVALIVGGTIGTLAQVFHPEEPTDPLNVPIHVVLYFGVLLVLFGLPGILTYQGSKVGALGILSGIVAFFGLAMMDLPHAALEMSLVPALTGDASLRPLLREDGPLSIGINNSPFGVVNTLAGPLMLIGFSLLGAAILRSRVLPRWTAWVIFGGTAGIVASLTLPFLQPFPAGVLLYIQPLVLGYTLFTEKTGARRAAPLRIAPAIAPRGD